MLDELPNLDSTLRGLRAGQVVFARYELLRLLGRGGMGVVWLARDQRLEIDLALKFLPEGIVDDSQALEDLKRETLRCRELAHEHIVRVHDLEHDRAAALAAISMESVPGQTLKALKDAEPGRCFEASALAAWVRQLGDALSYAHERKKIVHRDLKPANLMLTPEGVLKVMDFGIARSIAESHSRTSAGASASSGTPAYMSPQQIRGEKPGVRDDLYAFGATLYELLTSRPPFFRGDVNAIFYQVMHEQPVPLSVRREELEIEGREPIPPAWENVIAACLAKEPEQRPASIAEAVQQLFEPATPRGASKSLPPEPPIAVTLPPRPQPKPRRSPALWLSLLIVGVIVIGGWWGWQRQAQRNVAAQPGPPPVLALPTPEPPLPPEPRPSPAPVAKISATPTPRPATPAPKPPEPPLSERLAPVLAKAEEQRLHIQWPEALATLQAAEPLAPRAEHPKEWASLQHKRAEVLSDQSHYPEAIALYQEVLAERTRVLGAEDPATLETRYQLTDNKGNLKQTPTLLAEHKAILAVRQRVLGAEHRDTLRSRCSVADWEDDLNPQLDLREELRAVLASQQRLLGQDQRDSLATEYALIDYYSYRNQWAPAEQARKQLLEKSRQILDPHDPLLLRHRAKICYYQSMQGRGDRARQDLAVILADAIAYLGENHATTAELHGILSIVLHIGKLYDEAIAERKKAFAIKSRLFGADHPALFHDRQEIAATEASAKQYVAAESDLRSLLQDEERVLEPDDDVHLRTLYWLAWTLKERGKNSEARPYAERCVEGSRRVLPKEDMYRKATENLLQSLQGSSSKKKSK